MNRLRPPGTPALLFECKHHKSTVGQKQLLVNTPSLPVKHTVTPACQDTYPMHTILQNTPELLLQPQPTPTAPARLQSSAVKIRLPWQASLPLHNEKIGQHSVSGISLLPARLHILPTKKSGAVYSVLQDRRTLFAPSNHAPDSSKDIQLLFSLPARYDHSQRGNISTPPTLNEPTTP